MISFKQLALFTTVSMAFSATAMAQQVVKLGDAGVLSQQGQPLKVNLPYSGSAERVPLLRFTVEDVQVPAGFKAPAAKGFKMMQGDNNSHITLISKENVDAPNVTMVVKVAGTAGEARTYNLAVPVAQVAKGDAAAPAAAKKVMKKKAKRSYKRKIVAQDNLPPK